MFGNNSRFMQQSPAQDLNSFAPNKEVERAITTNEQLSLINPHIYGYDPDLYDSTNISNQIYNNSVSDGLGLFTMPHSLPFAPLTTQFGGQASDWAASNNPRGYIDSPLLNGLEKAQKQQSQAKPHLPKSLTQCRYEFCHTKNCQYKHSYGQQIKTENRQGRELKLYHITSEECALKILKSKIMLPGTHGYAGGGIYFGQSIKDCEKKAKKKGAVVVCNVEVGRSYIITSPQYSMNQQELKKRDCQSIKIEGLKTGVEYVIYDSNRIRVLQILKKDSQGMYKQFC